MDNLENEICKWVLRADQDIQGAEYLLAAPMHPKLNSVICYLCQQSVEKILKAKIISMGIEVPKVHDLRVLMKQICKDSSEENEKYRDVHSACVKLNLYSTKARYPEEDAGQTDAQASSACALARAAFDVLFKDLKICRLTR